MKKILTTMTAMTMALQANDSLSNELESNEKEFKEFTESNNEYISSESNSNTLGASGSFIDVFQGNHYIDLDNSGRPTAGDLFIHEATIENLTDVNASGVFFDAEMNTSIVSLLPNSVNTSQGSVLIGNSELDSDVIVDLNDINSGERANLSYVLKINPIADGVVHEFTHYGGEASSLNGLDFQNWLSNVNYFIYGNPTTAFTEETSGDMSDHFGDLTVVNIQSELERVSGTVGGVGEDFEDCFQFVIGPNRYFHNILLEDLTFTNENTSTIFRVYRGLPDIKDPRGNLMDTDIDEGDINQNIYGYHNYLMPDTYAVCLVEATPGQSYSFIIETEIIDPIFKSGFD